MNDAQVAELKVVLEGVALPAEKARLLEYAVQQRAEPPLVEALRALPEREYESLDEVAEELGPGPRGPQDSEVAQES